MVVTGDRLLWDIARASGLVAWMLISTSVFLGVAAAMKMTRRPRPPWYVDLHRFMGGLSVVFLAVHVGTLFADRVVPFGWVDVLVPLASRFRPLPVAAGVVAMYLLAAVEITSLLMRRVPRAIWKAVHGTTFMLFLLVSAHALTAGTDATNRLVRVVAAAQLAGFVFFVLFRWLAPRRVPRPSVVAVAESAGASR